MDEISLIDVRRVWIKNVAIAGSIPDAKCYKDAIQQICLGLSIAFCPSDDLDIISSGKNESNENDENANANAHKAEDNSIPSPESQPTNTQVSAQPQLTNSLQAMDEHTSLKKASVEEDVEMMVQYIHEDGDVKTANEDAGTRDAEMQDADEQPASNSNQSNREKVDKSSVAIIESIDTIEGNSNSSVVDLAARAMTSMNNLSHPAAFKIIRQPFYSTPLKPAYTQFRALYLDLVYQDRFILLNNPDFLFFLAEQPHCPTPSCNTSRTTLSVSATYTATAAMPTMASPLSLTPSCQ